MDISVSSIALVFSTSFMALFPVINPLGNVFIVNTYFADLNSKQRRVAAKKLVGNYILVGVGVLAIGHLLLTIFGLAIPIIKVGGGLLICKTAINLLSDGANSKPETTEESQQTSDLSKWKNIEKKLFYPITFPTSLGPGSISVIFTLMATASVKNNLMATSINYLVIAFVILSMATILYLLLTQGQKLIEKLGPSGNLIINKLVAFFTFCVGIQIMVEGVAGVFHITVL